MDSESSVARLDSCMKEDECPANERVPLVQDNSYTQDRRGTPPLADMAKPEAVLADMIKHETKPVANGAGPHVKPELPGADGTVQMAQQPRGHDESYIASLAKPPGPSTHSNIAPPPAVQGPAAGIAGHPRSGHMLLLPAPMQEACWSISTPQQ